LSWKNFLHSGTSYLRLCSNQRSRIFIFGNSLPLDNTRQNLLMSPCSLEPPLSAIARELEELGPWQMQVFYVAVERNRCWIVTSCQEKSTTSWVLSSVWSTWGNNRSFVGFVCFHLTGLVQLAT
jgi:hypothetical protein